MDFALACLVALVGNVVYSLGMAFQKRGIAWQKPVERDADGKRLPRAPGFARDLLTWSVGFLFVNLAPVFNFVAVGGAGASVTGAFLGTSVVFTALFARLFLGEPLTGRILALSAALLGSIVLASAGSISEGARAGEASSLALALLFLAPVVFAVAGARRGGTGGAAGGEPGGGRGSSREDARAALLGAASGSAGGLSLVAMEVARRADGLDFLAYLGNYPVWFYLAASIMAIAFMQLACRHGSLGAMSGALYGTQVAFPALASAAVFGEFPSALALSGVALTCAFAVLLARERGRTPVRS